MVLVCYIGLAFHRQPLSPLHEGVYIPGAAAHVAAGYAFAAEIMI